MKQYYLLISSIILCATPLLSMETSTSGSFKGFSGEYPIRKLSSHSGVSTPPFLSPGSEVELTHIHNNTPEAIGSLVESNILFNEEQKAPTPVQREELTEKMLYARYHLTRCLSEMAQSNAIQATSPQPINLVFEKKEVTPIARKASLLKQALTK